MHINFAVILNKELKFILQFVIELGAHRLVHCATMMENRNVIKFSRKLSSGRRCY